MELRSCCQVGDLVWMLISFSFVSIVMYIHLPEKFPMDTW
jgi:hypothetical protein